MAVKTALPKSKTSTKNVSTRTKTKMQAKKSQPRSGGGQFGSTAQMPPRKNGRPATATGQMNKGKGAVGASKPPKGVSRPAGGSKPKGGKGC
jgi:hypothetical protein